MIADLDRNLALQTVQQGARAYFETRRRRVDTFVDNHFSLPGTLSLHRHALGWDIARAPLNLSLALPQVAMHLGAAASARLGATATAARLRRPILLRTAVSREIEWLVTTEFLQLPCTQRGREATQDALCQTILAQPDLQAAMDTALQEIAARGTDPAFRARLGHAMESYGLARSAAAEITTGLLNLGAGALALNKVTPGAASFGPALAGVMAHQTAIGAFPLGTWLGGAWYGLFPTVPSAALVATTTGGVMLAATTFAAFAGVVSDPIQRALGLHQRRLLRMVDGLERQFFDPESAGFVVHDHYVARLLDVFDMVSAALRLARL